MSEVITRRFKRYFDEANIDGDKEGEGFSKLPDLILLDGGKGHVGVIAPILKEMGLSIPVFGMVKDNKHKTKAVATDNTEVSFSAVKSAFALVTSIQDEVHRFSLAYQKQKRTSSAFELTLTKVKGIGTKKAVALIKHFKTQKELRSATIEQLKEVAKISDQTAKELHEFLSE
ncbi:MAG: helix-hairpin-helix domain-containing protein, partial [Niameybacter sp.]